jgi:LmbE family N-acetylglucosaminyl deacetylase
VNKKHLILAGIIIAAAILAGYIYQDRIFHTFYRIRVQQMSGVPDKARLLVVAPHCDDEALGSAGLIQQVLSKNGKVKIVVVTNGDGSYRSILLNYGIERPAPKDYMDLGRIRQQETISAMEALGVSKEDIVFLGYPDGSMDLLWSANWKADNPLVNRYTRRSCSPYENSYHTNAAYTGENAAEGLTAIIKEFRPSIISYPHPNDEHRDHWAVHAFVKYALLSINTALPEELLYLVHFRNWPVPLGDNDRIEMKPPAALTGEATVWKSLALDDRIFGGKCRIIPFYKTQMKTMEDFLLAFQRENELYGEYPQISIPLSTTPSKSQAILTSPKESGFLDQPVTRGKIKAILLSTDQEKLQFKMKAYRELSPDNRYELEVIFFSVGREPIRITASCYKGRGAVSSMAGSKYAEKCFVKVASGRMTLTIPKNMIQQGDTALVNGRVYESKKTTTAPKQHNQKLLPSSKNHFGYIMKNRTAWRAVRFQ